MRLIVRVALRITRHLLLALCAGVLAAVYGSSCHSFVLQFYTQAVCASPNLATLSVGIDVMNPWWIVWGLIAITAAVGIGLMSYSAGRQAGVQSGFRRAKRELSVRQVSNNLATNSLNINRLLKTAKQRGVEQLKEQAHSLIWQKRGLPEVDKILRQTQLLGGYDAVVLGDNIGLVISGSSSELSRDGLTPRERHDLLSSLSSLLYPFFERCSQNHLHRPMWAALYDDQKRIGVSYHMFVVGQDTFFLAMLTPPSAVVSDNDDFELSHATVALLKQAIADG